MWKFTLKVPVCGVPADTEVEVAGFLPKYGEQDDVVSCLNSDGVYTYFIPIEKLNTCNDYSIFQSLAWFFRKPNGDCPMVYSHEMGEVFNDGITRVPIVRKAVKL